MLFFFFTAFTVVTIVNAKCIDKEEAAYLGVCNEYVTYPIWLDDNVVVATNNAYTIDRWINEVVSRYVYNLTPFQCALMYPTCYNGLPKRPCLSDCRRLLDGYLRSGPNINPCNNKIFYDDIASNNSLCTRILSSSEGIRIGFENLY